MPLQGEYYEVTAVTPEEGEVGYQTLDQGLARMIHSELMCVNQREVLKVSPSVWSDPHPALY